MVNRDGPSGRASPAEVSFFNTLLENNRNDLIYSMASKEIFPGWGHMLKAAHELLRGLGLCGSYLHNSYFICRQLVH